MNMPQLDPERIYQAIREGTKEAVLAAMSKTVSYQHSAGDRLTDAVKTGTAEAFQTALMRNTYGLRPGDLIKVAIETGTEKATKSKSVI